MSEPIEKTYKTVDDGDLTFTYRRTMLGDVRYRTWFGRYATEDAPDRIYRSDFAWIMAYVVKITGAKIKPLTQTATQDEFEAAYFALLALVDPDVWIEIADDVNAMREPATDDVQKPDDALTGDEAADPN